MDQSKQNFSNFVKVISRNFNEKFKSALGKCGNVFSVRTKGWAIDFVKPPSQGELDIRPPYIREQRGSKWKAEDPTQNKNSSLHYPPVV
jgi:hypothetical protein